MNTIEGLMRFFNDFNKAILDGYVHVLGNQEGKASIAIEYQKAGVPKDVKIMGIAGTRLHIMLVKKSKVFFTSSKNIAADQLDHVYSMFIDRARNLTCSATQNPIILLNYSLLVLITIFDILGIKRSALKEKGLTLVSDTFSISEFKREWL